MSTVVTGGHHHLCVVREPSQATRRSSRLVWMRLCLSGESCQNRPALLMWLRG